MGPNCDIFTLTIPIDDQPIAEVRDPEVIGSRQRAVVVAYTHAVELVTYRLVIPVPIHCDPADVGDAVVGRAAGATVAAQTNDPVGTRNCPEPGFRVDDQVRCRDVRIPKDHCRVCKQRTTTMQGRSFRQSVVASGTKGRHLPGRNSIRSDRRI